MSDVIELTPLGREMMQARKDVAFLLFALRYSGSSLASSPIVQEIVERYRSLPDCDAGEADVVPSLEEVVEDALAAKNWPALDRLLPDIAKLETAQFLSVVGRCQVAMGPEAFGACFGVGLYQLTMNANAEAAHA